MEVITHFISKSTTGLLFSPGDLPSTLPQILHRVPPHTGRKMINKYPDLARFQISHQLAINAPGVALIALIHCWSPSVLWLFADSETALATLLTSSFTLIQGILVRIFYLGLVWGFFCKKRDAEDVALSINVSSKITSCTLIMLNARRNS